ncbi:MAG: winged helix-turn-helix domain-containing protein [Candidatus Heimdallarchaeota archaeon]
MNSASNPLTQVKIQVLEDETRISIYVYLMVYGELTLKQLSEHLHKGKTTIHHHIRKLEESELVGYREDKKDARRQLKTRFYSLRGPDLSKGNEEHTIDLVKIKSLVISKLTEWWIDYLENQSDRDDFKEESSTFIMELNRPTEIGTETAPFTNLNTTIKMPILDILRWKEKNFKK